MKKSLRPWLVCAALILGGAGSETRASQFEDVGDRVKIETSGEQSSLDRATGKVISTANVRITNQGDRALEPPFHVVVELSGPDAASAVVANSAGGVGQPPYLFPYLDLSAQVGQELAPGGSVSFTLSLSRGAGQQVTYSFRPKAQVNRDPVAVAGGPYAGRMAEAVTLNGGASSDPDGDAITLRWLFDDGTSAAGATTSKTFSTTGIHNVVLEVTDAKGAQNRQSIEANIRPTGGFALGRTRTLDGAGIPLRSLRIEEIPAGGGMRVRQSDAFTGYSSLGSVAGSYVWKFSREGYASVYRAATLIEGEVTIIPDPRLVLLETARSSVSPISEVQLRTRDNRITLDLPSGAVLQPATAAITSMDAQALPLPPPANWTALAAFNFAIDQPPAQAAVAHIDLAGGLMPARVVVAAYFDESTLTWKTTAILAGTSGSPVPVSVDAAGTHAVLLADQGPGAPPPPTVGAAVPPGPDASAIFEPTGVTATGTVNPQMSAASTDPDRVTATATVSFQSPSGIPSSTWFRTEVEESYLLKNGTTIRTPDYDATVLAFRGPDGAATAASAAFPMRPQLLFGAEDLESATIRTRVISPAGFDGAVIDSSGGSISRNGVRFDVPAAALGETTAIEMRPLSDASFAGTLSTGYEVAKAFEWNAPGFGAGSVIEVSFDPLSPNSHFVLGRIVFGINGFGIEPLQRFKTDANGLATSDEPAAGDRLPGAAVSGHFLLVKTPAPLALVRGVVTEGGSLVEVSGQPWMAYSGAGGQFFLLAPAGQLKLLATNFDNGHDGVAVGSVVDVTETTNLDVDMSASGPRVVAITPMDGAKDVSAVTDIRLTFSKAIDPASLGTGGIVIRDDTNATVPAALSIDAKQKVVSLFPTDPLTAGATFHVAIAATVAGTNGLAVEGARDFSFSTAPPAVRGDGGQLVIYEPGAANIPAGVLAQLVGYVPGAGSTQVVAQGNAGVADPNVPVILVNEATGETATVLSKPDGSFANFIHAAEEDFISAVFVNANGTRVSVPATRQLFDDGRVGLYRQGGILEAQSDGGPVQVIVEPKAIAQRSTFEVEGDALAEVLAFLQGALPENATIIAGLNFTAEGDPLSQSAHVVVPLPPDQLGLPVGTPPEQGQFILSRVVEVDGVKVNEVIDSMSYKDGALRTASPPFLGLVGSGLLAISSVPTQSAIITGRVVVAPEGTPAGQLTETGAAGGADGMFKTILDFPPVAGAAVGFDSIEALNSNLLGLRPGSFMARTNSVGFYALKVPVVNDDPIGVYAQSILFPGRKPGGPAVREPGLPTAGQSEIRIKNLAFLMPSGSAGDATPPLVTLEQQYQVLPVDTPANLTIHLFDNASTPQLQSADWVRGGPQNPNKFSFLLVDGSPLPDPDVTFIQGSPITRGTNAVDVPLTVTVKSAAILVVRATAADQAGNAQTRDFPVRFGPNLPVPNDPLQPSDPNDAIPPRVTSIRPGPGEVVGSLSEITVTFSEAVSQDIETSQGAIGVYGSISNGVPVTVELAPDQLSAKIRPIGLQPGDDVNVGLTSIVRDLKGNALLPFSSNFTIASVPSYALHETDGVAATVSAGNFEYSLVRAGDVNSHKLVVHQLGDTSAAGPAGTLLLPPFPRAMVHVPKFAFKRTLDQGTVEQKPLLIIAGGLLGEDQVGQWLWVVDVSDAAHPTRIASQLAVPDFAAAITMLKYSDGQVFVGVNTSEAAMIYRIVLQTFILGSNFTREDFDIHPPDPGLDLDRNGDFVGQGERLPIPEKKTLFGLDVTFPLAPGRFLNDFDALAGGAFLVTTFANKGIDVLARLQVVMFGGQLVGFGGDDQGKAEFGTGVNATRVLLEEQFRVQDQAGTSTIPLVAIVAAGPKLLVYDISSNPHHPTALRTLELPLGSGSILSLFRDGGDRYIAGTGGKLFVFDRELMGGPQATGGTPSPSIVGSVALGSVGRYLGVSDAFFVGLSGGSIKVQPRAPRIAMVRFPAHAVLDTSTIAGMADPDQFAKQLLDGMVEEFFLMPSPLRGFGPSFPSSLAMPPPPSFHYYVLVRASGSLGPQVKLAIEGTDRHGQRLAPQGIVSPPVLLSDHAGAANIANAQPVATAQYANRMSNDPNSDFYNLYLSQPLLVARDPVSPTILAQIASQTGRQAVQMGERLRISIEDASNTTSAYSPLFTHTPSPDQPPSGMSESFDSFCADFIDSLNPSMRSASPRVDGVSLQSGEFTHRATDLVVEGRGLDLVLSRVYESQTHYRGAFGRGWDCPFFRRLCDLPSGLVPAEVQLPLTFYGDPAKDLIARPGDVMIQDGAGDMKLYRQISAANGNLDKLPLFQNDPAITEFNWGGGKIAVYYFPPPGSFDMLVRFTDGSYASIDPQATRHYYDAEGRITRIVSAYDEARLKFEYRSDGKLDKIIGDNGTNLELGYYGRTTSPDFKTAIDKPFPDEARLGLIARVKAGSENVEYTYDGNASLTKVESSSPTPQIYGYDTAYPFLLTVIGTQDGTQGPSQKITYADGVVTDVETDGVRRSFNGAKATAQERHSLATADLTATTNGKVAHFGVNANGLPTSFAGRTVAASDDGQIQTFGVGNEGLENIFDINNQVYRFRGNLTGVNGKAGQDGGTLVYDGTAWNRLQSQTSPEGVTTSYVYQNSAGHNMATQVTMTTGPVTRKMYFNDWGQLASEDDTEAGTTFSRTTLFSGGLASERKEGAVTTARINRGTGTKLASVEHGGITQTPTIGSDGQLTGISSGADGPSLSLGFDVGSGNNSSTSITGAAVTLSETMTQNASDPDRPSGFTFNQTGVPAENGTFTYGPDGQLTGYTGPETVKMTYDGVLPKTYDAPGEHYSATYGAGGRVATMTQNGLDVVMSYDGRGRPTMMTHGSTSRSLTYHGGRQIASETVTDADGTLSNLQFTYDGAGRLKTVVGDAVTKTYDYFPDGSIRSVKLGNFEVSQFERDSGGFLTDAHFFGNATSISLRNLEPVFALPQLQTTTYIGGESVVENITYDSFGRVLTHRTGNLNPTSYTYDSFGNQTSVTDPDGVVLASTYAPTGLPLTQTFADGTSISMSYDAAWNVLNRGNITFGYNNEGLIESVFYPDGSSATFSGLNGFLEATTVSYGSLTQAHSYTDGRRTEISAAGDVLSATYDGLGRVKTISFNGYATTYGYSADLGLKSEEGPLGRWEIALNGDGQITAETYPSGVNSSFSPGAAGLMTQHPAAGASRVEWADLEVLRSITYANGITMTREFDRAMRPFRVKWEKQGNVVAGLEWALTDGGRITSEKRLHSGSWDVYTRNAATAGMRVTAVQFGATDPAGTGAVQTVSGIAFADGEITFAGATAAGSGARSTIPLPTDVLGHDDRGVVTQGPVWVNRASGLQRVNAQFDYDGLLRVKAIRLLDANSDVQVTVAYQRDGAGRIVRRTVVGDAAVCQPGVWRYAWRDEHLIEEYAVIDGQDQLAARYFWAVDDLIRIERASIPGGPLTGYVPVCGLNGSVAGYLDDAGAMVEEIRYGLFGLPEAVSAGGIIPRSTIDGRLLFHGAFFEPEAGLYDMGRRTLHPVFGQFLQRDSELYTDSLALYTAFDGDSASNVDHDGTAATKLELGKSAGWWTDVVAYVVKGGIVSDKKSKGLNWKFKKNSRFVGFSARALGFAADFFPKGSLGEQVFSSASTAHSVLGYGLEAVEISYKMKDAANLVKNALNVENGLRLRNAAEEAQWRRLYIIMPTERHEQQWRDALARRRNELAAARQEAKGITKRYRMEQRMARLAAAKLGVGLAGAIFESVFKPSRGETSEAYELGVGAFKEAGILLDIARLNTNYKLGKLTGKAELMIGGGFLSGNASSVLMRGLAHVQAADLWFQAGFEGASRIGLPLFYRFAISPQASADYRAMAQQFRDDGGFGLKLLGGFLNSRQLISDDTTFRLLMASDFSLAGFIKAGFESAEQRNAAYILGLEAP